jgi:hypothetical protein
MNETGHSPVNFSMKSIAIGVVCLVAAHLLLFLLQSMVALPFSMFVQQTMATAVGVLAWFYVGAKLGA